MFALEFFRNSICQSVYAGYCIRLTTGQDQLVAHQVNISDRCEPLFRSDGEPKISDGKTK